MKNINPVAQLLFPGYLSVLGEFLIKWSEASLFPAVVKSITPDNNLANQKILVHNQMSAKFWGFSDQGMSDMKLLELYERLSPLDRESHMARVKMTNQEALERQTQTTQVQVILDAEGYVRIYERVVTPVSGSTGKILAISVLSVEATQYSNLFYLLGLYKKYYARKSQAIKQFSAYLKLDHYFEVPLNSGELSVLLAMENVRRYKQIAERLAISPKTVDSYLDSIKYKLKNGFTLFIVLNNLRESRQLRLVEGMR